MAKVHDKWCPSQFCTKVDCTECTCPDQSEVPDGRNPAGIEHLCARDLTVQDGPVEECCIAEWIDEGVRVE